LNFDLSQIKFSKKDIVKGIKLPNKLTPELAEIIGLHIGDGHLGYRANKKQFVLQLMGDPKTEKLHYDKYISKLWKKVFNLDVSLKDHPNKCYGFQIYSQVLGLFFNKILQMPIGKKSKTIRIPVLLKNTCKNGISKEMVACLRGIIDTDFYASRDRNTIELGAWFASRDLILDLKKYLNMLSINPTIRLNVKHHDADNRKNKFRHSIRIRKQGDIELYLKKIGSFNPKIYKKINVF